MLIPTKHEDLQKNSLVVGADIINLLKKRKYNIEALFSETKSQKDISLDSFYNTLTFLWICGVVDMDRYSISLNK